MLRKVVIVGLLRIAVGCDGGGIGVAISAVYGRLLRRGGLLCCRVSLLVCTVGLWYYSRL